MERAPPEDQQSAAGAAASAAARTFRVPTTTELRAYHELLKLAQQLQREPTAEEAFPLVRHVSRRLRGRERIGTQREARTDSTVSSRRVVDEVVRGLMARCGVYLGDVERCRGLRAQLVDMAFRTARDVMTPGGPYDGNAQLAAAKARLCSDLFRIGGLSEERQGRDADKPNDSLGRTLTPDEQALVERARRLDYENQMRERMGDGAAAAVGHNRLSPN